MARRAVLFVLLAALLGMAGCRSNQAETDLIQREMRQQEDQIYALQDYLAEYQQLLCEARMENTSLRRELVSGQFKDGRPGDAGDVRDSLPKPTPSSISPTPPPITPEPPAGGSVPSSPPEESIDMTLPDAPPLEIPATPAPPTRQGSRIEPRRRDHRITAAVAELDDSAQEAIAEVAAAAHVESVPAKAPFKKRGNDAQAKPTPLKPATFGPLAAVAVRAEVTIDAAAPGPRVLVDVLPLSAEGGAARLDGNMSLLIRNPNGLGNSKDIARWDFTRHELKQFARDTSQGAAYVFPLQLPAAARVKGPVELWVRVVPKSGEKVLSRATLDMSRSGRFVFDERMRSGTAEFVVKQASAEVPTSGSNNAGSPRSTVTNVDGWQIARPGDRPDDSPAAGRVQSEWRVATQPIPVVESHPVTPDSLDAYPIADRYGPEVPVESDAAPRELPQWSPERSDEPATPDDDSAWSATR